LMIGNMSRVEEGKAHGLLAIDLKEGKCWVTDVLEMKEIVDFFLEKEIKERVWHLSFVKQRN
jgi:hypothetical protein